MIYSDFIQAKRHSAKPVGIDLSVRCSALKPFQEHLTAWALHQGRAGIFADCGLGKTIMLLTWAQNIHEQTGQRVLVVCPLAVSGQIEAEARKFGLLGQVSRNGQPHPVTITNYQRLHMFSPSAFGGMVCDESGILKNSDGAIRSAVVEFMRQMPYRLLASATPAPNDYTELGNSSEALGYLGYQDMLSRFFVSSTGANTNKRMYGEAPEWRLKGHAAAPFWEWVATWCKSVRRPSDIGYDDDGYSLPPISYNRHAVQSGYLEEGALFAMPSANIHEQRRAKRATITERVNMAADILSGDAPGIAWAHLNDEADGLEKSIRGSVQVSGKDTVEEAERKIAMFLDGTARVLVAKPQQCGWGLNLQHCSRMTYFPSHSFEQLYQSVRRCWRFGQKSPVECHFVMTELEGKVIENLEQKQAKAEQMHDMLNAAINGHDLRPTERATYIEVPKWI